MEIKLKEIVTKKLSSNKRIVWNSLDIKDYYKFAQKRTKELKLKSVAEYCVYLFNNYKLPNRICKCGKIKSFSTTKKPYADFCSKKCVIKYSEQLSNENKLIKYIQEHNNNIDYGSKFMSQYKNFINKQSKNFDNKSEYITYLFNNKSLPDSICKCGNKKPYKFPKAPYRKYCSKKCANKYLMTEERKIKTSKSVSKFMKSCYNKYFDKRTEVHRETIKSASIEYKEEKRKAKSKCMLNVYKTTKIKQKIRQTNETLGNWITESEVQNFKDYSRLVWRYTNANNLSTLKNIENRGVKVHQYHLDHKYSIYQGFKDRIPAEIIGNICNLEMLISGRNLSKNKKCSISKDSLYESFEKLI